VFPIPFADYSLRARLGRGGMALVYDAERDALMRSEHRSKGAVNER